MEEKQSFLKKIKKMFNDMFGVNSNTDNKIKEKIASYGLNNNPRVRELENMFYEKIYVTNNKKIENSVNNPNKSRQPNGFPNERE